MAVGLDTSETEVKIFRQAFGKGWGLSRQVFKKKRKGGGQRFFKYASDRRDRRNKNFRQAFKNATDRREGAGGHLGFVLEKKKVWSSWICRRICVQRRPSWICYKSNVYFWDQQLETRPTEGREGA